MREPTRIPTQREAFAFYVRLLVLVRPYWRPLVRGLVMGLAVGIIPLAIPYTSKLFIDQVYPTRDVPLMVLLVVATAVMNVANSLLGTVRSYFSQVVSQRLGSATTLMFFNHLQHLPIRFFEQHRVGEVMSRFGDVRGALNSLSTTVQTVFTAGTYLLLVPPLLFAFHWRLALVSIATLPVTTAIGIISGRWLRRYSQQTAEAAAELNAFQIETLTQIRTYKGLAAESHVFRTARDHNATLLGLQLRSGLFGGAVGIVSGIVRTTGTAVFTWYAWTLILHNELTLGGFIAFSGYIGYLSGPVTQLAGLFTSFQHTAVTLGRMFEYLDEEPEQEPQQAFSAMPDPPKWTAPRVRLRDVTFGYTPDRLALHNVSIDLEPGVVTAIVGPSGAGKTSVLRLISRFSDPTSGTIEVGGRSSRSMPLSELRSNVAVVWQEFSLVRGTIWENLTLGLASPDRGRVDAAVRTCRLESLIGGLPDGYDTLVAEWGATLSGGQRQRLAIARALIRDTPILLLDEATSQIDGETEVELLRDLFESDHGRTIAFVTHRLNSAALAHYIHVIVDGRLAGSGTHRELMEDCDPYRSLAIASGYSHPVESRVLRRVGSL